MLLASSVTPSGSAWAVSAARASVPSAQVVELTDFDERDVVRALAAAVGVPGATRVADDLSGALSAIRRTATLMAAFEFAESKHDPTIVVVDAAVPDVVADLCSLSALLRASAPEFELTDRLQSICDAIAKGRFEWLLAVPPESAAIETATIQVAQGCALGLSMRGVLVAPMPRKADGWPSGIRRAARELVEDLQDRLFGIAVKRVRGGRVCSFSSPDLDSRSPIVTEDSGGMFLLSCTIPGARYCDLEVGVWSEEPSYPGTHLVLRLDGLTARMELDSTLRRCVAVEAVVAGDTITVPFAPDPGQWPAASKEANR